MSWNIWQTRVVADAPGLASGPARCLHDAPATSIAQRCSSHRPFASPVRDARIHDSSTSSASAGERRVRACSQARFRWEPHARSPRPHGPATSGRPTAAQVPGRPAGRRMGSRPNGRWIRSSRGGCPSCPGVTVDLVPVQADRTEMDGSRSHRSAGRGATGADVGGRVGGRDNSSVSAPARREHHSHRGPPPARRGAGARPPTPPGSRPEPRGRCGSGAHRRPPCDRSRGRRPGGSQPPGPAVSLATNATSSRSCLRVDRRQKSGRLAGRPVLRG